jgi:hypothetical protein
MRWLYRTITGKTPLQFRFEFALWTPEIVRVLLREAVPVGTEPGQCGAVAETTGVDVSAPAIPCHGTRSGTSAPLAGGGVSGHSGTGPARRGRDLFWGRSGRTVGLPCGNDLGYPGADTGGAQHGPAEFGEHVSAVSAGGAMRFMLAKGDLIGPIAIEATSGTAGLNGPRRNTSYGISHPSGWPAPVRTRCVSIYIGLRASFFRAISCGKRHTLQTAYRRHQPSCPGPWFGLLCKPSFRHPEALEQISPSPDHSGERADRSRNFVPGSRVDWWTPLEPMPHSL